MNLLKKSLADYVASVISPMLIMTLVGSLVFFLVEVLYVGQYQDRVLWFFFFFVFGAVLVSRMSLSGATANRAGLYAVVLGALMWLALQLFLQFPARSLAAQVSWAVNLGLILILWWSAHRLTVDSTFVDDRTDVSGRGLMDAAGLDVQGQPAEDAPTATDEDRKPATDEEEPERRPERVGSLVSWWERWQKYRAAQKERPRTHGVWVVYFSLAALPLFGVGQSLIPPQEAGRRWYVFLLLAVYLASGLGLLLTTSFLSLRRYLAQRKLQMPVAITGTWLTFGLGLIGLFLIVGALLPRPNAEFSVLDSVFKTDSPKRDASQWAFKGDGKPGEGQGRAQAGDKGEQGDNTGKGQGKGQGSGKDGKGSGRQGQGNNGKGQSGKGEQSKSQGDKNAQNSANSGKQNDKAGQGQKAQRDGNQGQNKDDQAQAGKKDAGDQQQQEGKSGAPAAQATPPPPSAPNFALPEWLKPALEFLKWIVLGLIGLVILFVVLRSLLGFLANFTGWAKSLLDWFRALWEAFWRPRSRADRQAAAASTAARPSWRPFSTYRDPFQSGSARRMSPAELIRYSFEALEAWAREHDLARTADETPLEFTNRVGAAVPELARDVRRLANYYAAAAYAPRILGDNCAAGLRQFWETLMGVAVGETLGD